MPAQCMISMFGIINKDKVKTAFTTNKGLISLNFWLFVSLIHQLHFNRSSNRFSIEHCSVYIEIKVKSGFYIAQYVHKTGL